MLTTLAALEVASLDQAGLARLGGSGLGGRSLRATGLDRLVDDGIHSVLLRVW